MAFKIPSIQDITNKAGNLLDTWKSNAEINTNYQNLYGRPGTKEDLDYWKQSGLTGVDLTKTMIDAGKDYGNTYTSGGKTYDNPYAIPEANVTMPSNSNSNAQGWANSLSKSIPNYFDAYKSLKKLPSQIDEWTQNAMNRQRATGDQAAGIFNAVGNQRAGSGIMGGTEYDNAIANYQTNLAKLLMENKSNIELAGNTMKVNAIANLPGQAMSGVNAMSTLYGQNAADQQNWAQLAANIINASY